MDDVLCKIIASLLWIITAAICVIAFTYVGSIHDKDKDCKTSLAYYCLEHQGLLYLVLALVGFEFFQLGFMFWNGTMPYIVGDVDGELISTHWLSSIRYKCIILLSVGFIYYIVKFFQREKDFQEFKYSEKKKMELMEKCKDLENKSFRNLTLLEDNLPKIVNCLNEGTFIYVKYIKYHDGKIYKLYKDALGGIGLPVDEDVKNTWKDWISIYDIASDLHHGDAYIYDITKDQIEITKSL